MANEKKTDLDLAYCTYVLNGEPISRLVCDGISYEAFSGDSASYVNDVRFQDVVKKGPLPLGKYYILDRESGGLMGVAGQSLNDFFAGTNRSTWLSLYRDDGVIDDQTIINNTQRGAFRIHPVGPRGISEGCVTLTSGIGFEELRRNIRNRSGAIIPGRDIRYYGILEVIEEKVITTQ
ncbi:MULTISPECIES: DUF2778 domain-containing protein [unclassified Pseudomonas]|uniref:DUF2778 domain-containing protein n=1 Tax=unclassified Pseudomonas TaxID=196821 RepID=UPI000D3C3562|nr:MULTISPECIES: DUF2778 domain-containing protein [unclassified Pseudomonas]RAU49648.1 DUF2778 domain-containing protein [Pseudomonas sp. RIT 409]RAU55613.1 DUF2778 domain-containing protein [Pseudomonas sp. RIT 412]